MTTLPTTVFSNDALCEILGASSRVTTSLVLDLAFGAVDVNVDLACTSLLSPLSPLPPSIASPPPSAAAREHAMMPGSDSEDSGFGDDLALTSTQTARACQRQEDADQGRKWGGELQASVKL